MIEFFSDIITFPFLRNALLVIIFASIASGISGSFVVKKKMTFVSGGLAHAIMGGIGVSYFLKLNIMIGAVIFALLFALIITIAKHRSHQEEDTLIGVLWAVGMSIGIIFIHLTPGYNVDLMSFIFGNILMVQPQDLTNIILMDSVIILMILIFYRQFLFVSFDEDFLHVNGLNIDLFYFLLLALVSMTVVILIKVVGLILVISMLTIPVAVADHFTKSFFKLMLFSTVLNIIFGIVGIFFAFQFNVPASASIVLSAGVVFLITVMLKRR